MNEIEEIRQRFANRPNHVIWIVLDELATHARRLEEVEQRVGDIRGPGCISGCFHGTDDKFHHHPYCQTFGGEKPLEMGGRRWIEESRHNLEVLRLGRRLEEARAALSDAPDRTCESPEARAWREKHADALARLSQPPSPTREEGGR